MLTSTESFFTEDSLKIKKGPGTSFQTTFFIEFFDKKYIFCNITSTGQISLPDCIYFPSYSICFKFQAWTFDDIMIFKYLKC